MHRTRTLQDLEPGELRGKYVLVRVDFNVPLDPQGAVADPMRIEAALPSLVRLREGGARSILVSHLGRPDGTRDPSASLRPVSEWLGARIGTEVPLLPDAPGTPELAASLDDLASGEMVILENIRFQPGETRNDPELSAALGGLAEAFVGEAFGTAHRAHASNVGAAREIRDKGGPAVAGFLMAREIHFLGEALRDPERPFVAVMGGAKISGKIDLIRAILPRVDRLLVGGAMANTFFRALGLDTGASLVEEDRIRMAGDLLEEAGEKLLLPVDCVVADGIEPSAEAEVVDRTGVPADRKILDIGPDSRELFSRELAKARTIVWNGPMGVFESEPFAEGTYHIGRALAEAAERDAVVVVGGGDSAAAAEAAGVLDRMTHVSTGGGASLDLLAGRELPGVSVLQTLEE